MKKRFAALILAPLILASCGQKGIGFDSLAIKIATIEKSDLHPYYRVVGVLDFNNSVTEVDALFDQMPNGTTFVPYSRFNEGFYLPMYDVGNEDDVLYYQIASRSYWLCIPLKIDRENFLVFDEEGVMNPTCVFANIRETILSWYGGVGSANPSSCYLYYEFLPNGGFAIAGDKVHTSVTIDNYPCYPDTDSPYQPWNKNYNAFPARNNKVDGKFNIRFEYDANGWLKREYLASIDYDYSKASYSQVCLESRYYYQNEDVTW